MEALLKALLGQQVEVYVSGQYGGNQVQGIMVKDGEGFYIVEDEMFLPVDVTEITSNNTTNKISVNF